jgi:hypothetical protein
MYIGCILTLNHLSKGSFKYQTHICIAFRLINQSIVMMNYVYFSFLLGQYLG